MTREMVDSGCKYLGIIPKSWKINKFKYYLFRRDVKNRSDCEVLSLYREHGIVIKNSRDDNHNVTSEDTSKYRYVRINDFVVNKMKAWQGSVAVSEYEGIVSPAYYVYEFSDDSYCPKYFHYLLRSAYKNEFRRLSGGIREGQWDLSTNALENILVILPPLPEQQKIAAFLDDKCAIIDSLIADIQAEIQKLEQLKRSVITEAVTKGLDHNVEMSDSGITWIGKIPKHWTKHPIYFYFNERKNKNTLGREENLLSLSYGKIIRKDINTNGGLLPESFNTYNIIEKNDIVIRPTDLQNDKRSLRTGIAKERGIITSAYITMKSLKPISPEYFHFLLHSYDVMKVFYNMGNGVRQSLNFSEFSKLMMLEPPIHEQNAIVSYLKEKCEEFETIIIEKNKQLEILQNLKKTVIYEYVTGKKEVK